MIGQVVQLVAAVVLSGCLMVGIIALMKLWGADTSGPPEPCVYCEDVRGREPKETPHRDGADDPICRHCAREVGLR